MSNEKFETMLKNVSISELDVLYKKISLLGSIAENGSKIKRKFSFDGISDLVNSIYCKTPFEQKNALYEYDTEDECDCPCCTQGYCDCEDECGEILYGCVDCKEKDANDQSNYYIGCDSESGNRTAYYTDASNLDAQSLGKILGDIKKSEEPKKDETNEMSLSSFIKNVADSCDATLSEISEFIKFKKDNKEVK